ncbi:MAG: hypothetical protein P4L22_05040 [Candidatus Babeliales bacterium]|nr:hypothetical protein [Candidatus Babeliales bacterium]
MKKSLLIFILLFYINNISSIIIILQGSGCAGKTSICKEFQKLDMSCKILDEDQVFYDNHPNNIANIFPIEVEIIAKAVDSANLFHAIVRNQIFFKNSATDIEKNAAIETIKKVQKVLDSKTKEMKAINDVWNNFYVDHIMRAVRDCAITGNNVIIDHWFLSQEHIDELNKEFKVVVALAYSPFESLVQRTLKRNKESVEKRNFSQIRFFTQALMSFKDKYHLVPESEVKDFESENKPIETLLLENLKTNLAIVEASLDESIHAQGDANSQTRGEFSKKQFKEFKYELIKNFQKEPMCHVIPKSKYDILLPTDKQSSLECAQLLLKII